MDKHRKELIANLASVHKKKSKQATSQGGEFEIYKGA